LLALIFCKEVCIVAGKYRYFTLEDRKEIAKRWRHGERVPDIAQAVGSNEGTVYKELRRGWDGTTDKNLRRTYDPVMAHNKFRAVMSERGRRNASKAAGRDS
jgi:IS30 family transposase